ncbi:Acyl-CoA dehydrogenase [Actinokineospora alba]|uniref:Acyl-CoA dehydrogenase n=1 Tax=Actinokineospora alba TaxID=504798 RepID=A0A1H0UG76_9PSEU|nr:alkylation response protein AidB-like acyl-CoA dehydrogenase [Actinokineospora alba]SDH54096.1 Acyl-CoA dehydrogenase [Actinokineospora alba]SDP65292.1 Acyl-CoA dehydrogenase [Actinokineospora alba]
MTQERIALRDTVRLLLSRTSDVRTAMESDLGYDPALWKRLCSDIGVAALAIPERFGGLGAGIAETAVVLGELGRTLTPAPLLGTTLATHALLASGDDDACARLLPEVATGRIVTLVWSDAQGTWRDPPCVAKGQWVTGQAHYVLDGDIADTVLVFALAGPEIGLFEVTADAPGLVRTSTPTLDPTRRLTTVTVDSPAVRLGGDLTSALPRIRDLACVALSAEQAGAAAHCLNETVRYSKERVQFGRPIGSFQALKHRMADLHVLVETARATAEAAAEADVSALPVLAAAARIHCTEAFQTVAAEMIQLHGGIAITWEHDAHLYFKRAHGTSRLFGPVSDHLAAFTSSRHGGTR